jgi:2-methylaconitate cis-trans-isomerase PrpF
VPQRALPAVLMRGGTSKGLFVQERDLPVGGSERDALFLELLGSPDPMQIDGLGGTFSSTSKVMVVSPSSEPDCDIDYLFAQVAVERPVVDYRGNCGNLTAAVGPYALDEGLVAPHEPVTIVRLRNRNTGVRVLAHVPVHAGRAAVQGEHRIAGVPRPGARIDTEYLDPAGAVFGRLFPTGEPRDVLHVDGAAVEVSIVDVANPVAFVRAADLGLDGTELPHVVNADAPLLARLERVRAACAVRLGLVERPEDAADVTPLLPFLSLVRPPVAFETTLGAQLAADDMELCARSLSVQKAHHAYQMTALMCTAAAARLPGTLVHEVARDRAAGEVRVGHPKGTAAASVRVEHDGGAPRVAAVAVSRTARRLMAGAVYYRAPVPGSEHAATARAAEEVAP